MQMKAELKKGLHNAELTLFSEAELADAEWEHAKEFFLGDEKYDVVKVVQTAKGKVYHCVNDKKEKELYRQLDQNKKQKTILDELIKKFCLYSNTSQYNVSHLTVHNTQYSHYRGKTYHYCFSQFSFRPPIA